VKIVAVDMTEGKLDAAREFGATHGVLATEEKMHRKIQQITDGRGADYVFITVDVGVKYGQHCVEALYSLSDRALPARAAETR
jgi:S-(hydroxymethyl)glutathione dehydrogenase/alcohol dehydrogenase